MKTEKIKKKIEKVIKKFPTKITILRSDLNKYKEFESDIYVTELTGFYHESTSTGSGVNRTVTDEGNIKKTKVPYLMVVYDEKSTLVREGDYFYFNDKKYTIVDLGNLNMLNIYFDFALEVSEYNGI